ncbi:hemerythrin domain-containing protein [Streptomyces sp. NPDC045431]|uniref:hemerythrin domain-containing protein n=1 Tax=Streptomyces sp. NPDC045431 TaxID=3155613 RepID=UPI0033E3E435
MPMPEASGGGGQDVVALLEEQHVRLRRLFDELMRSEGKAREERFGELAGLLAVHEAAEEEMVHPFARGRIEDGERIVEQRLEEEKRVRAGLRALEELGGELGVDAPEFAERCAALRDDLMAHAEAEEREEFARLRETSDHDQLENLAKAVKAAQAVAPSRPGRGTTPATR